MPNSDIKHLLFPITYDCNLKCPGCCAPKDRPVDIERALGHLEDAEVEWVFITGGEPFMVPNLFEVAQRIRDMGFKVGVTTNGTIHRPEIVNYVDRVGVSIDGNKEYHDAYRGEGNYDKSMAFIEMIKGQTEVVIMSVAFKDNQEALRKLKPVVDEIDPAYWQIQRDYSDPSVVVPEDL